MSVESPEPPSPDPDTGHLRMAVFRLARRLRAERADDSLSDGQLAVLHHLKTAGPLTVGALAERERVSPPSMTRTVNCLADTDYVRREGDPEDGRRVRVLLTDAGAAIIAETARRRDAWLGGVIDGLAPAEREALAAAVPLLQRMAER